jgi:hypothetical protein
MNWINTKNSKINSIDTKDVVNYLLILSNSN